MAGNNTKEQCSCISIMVPSKTEWFTKKKQEILLLSISRNSLQTSSSGDILLVNFTLSNSFISLKDLIKWKRGFEIFLIDHYAGDIGNKNITGKY